MTPAYIIGRKFRFEGTIWDVVGSIKGKYLIKNTTSGEERLVTTFFIELGLTDEDWLGWNEVA